MLMLHCSLNTVKLEGFITDLPGYVITIPVNGFEIMVLQILKLVNNSVNAFRKSAITGSMRGLTLIVIQHICVDNIA